MSKEPFISRRIVLGGLAALSPSASAARGEKKQPSIDAQRQQQLSPSEFYVIEDISDIEQLSVPAHIKIIRVSGLLERGRKSVELYETSRTGRTIYRRQDRIGRWFEISSFIHDVDQHGAIGDGQKHELNERYPTLANAQADYPFVSSLRQSIDWAALQSAINTGCQVEILTGDSRRTFVLSDSIRSPKNITMRLIGSGRHAISLRVANEFRGFILNPQGSYEIVGLEIYGAGVDGQHGIGCNDPGSGGGGAWLDDVGLVNLDYGIYFGGNYQHPLGLRYGRVYGQAFRTCGISIGGLASEPGSGFNGESAFSFDSTIILTNANSSGIEYPCKIGSSSPREALDTVTWSYDSVPRFGFCVLRSQDGRNKWHVPPNWSRGDFLESSFEAEKAIGETWRYKVVRMTIGCHLRRAKSVSFDTLQCENFGVGLLFENVDSFDVQVFYYENSNDSHGSTSPTPRPNFCGVWGKRSRGRIGQTWCEYAGYGIFSADNSHIKVDGISASKNFWAAFGTGGARDQFLDYSDANIFGGTPFTHRAPNASSRDYQLRGLDYSTSSMVYRLSHNTSVAIGINQGSEGEAYISCKDGIATFRLQGKTSSSVELITPSRSHTVLSADSSGSNLSVNRLDVDPLSKIDLIVPLKSPNPLHHKNTVISNGITSPIFDLIVPQGDSVGLIWSFTICATMPDGRRGIINGMISFCAFDIDTTKDLPGVNISSFGLVKASSLKDLSDPLFSVRPLDSQRRAVVDCRIDTDTGADITISLVPISLGGGRASDINIR